MLGRGFPRLALRLVPSVSLCVSWEGVSLGASVFPSRISLALSSCPIAIIVVFSSSTQSSNLVAHPSPPIIFPIKQHKNEEQENRERERDGSERDGEARHERRYRIINHLITFSPDPLLRALPRLRPLNNPPPPGRGRSRREQDGHADGMMIASGEGVPCRSLTAFVRYSTFTT